MGVGSECAEVVRRQRSAAGSSLALWPTVRRVFRRALDGRGALPPGEPNPECAVTSRFVVLRRCVLGMSPRVCCSRELPHAQGP